MSTAAGSVSSPAVSALTDALARIVAQKRVLTRPIERIAYASDASFYRLIPQAVARGRWARTREPPQARATTQ